MAIRYKPEVHEYIRTHYKGANPSALAEEVNALFGTEFTRQKMRAYFKNHGYRTGAPTGHPKGWHPPEWPQEVRDFILASYKGTGYREMIRKLRDEFGREFTMNQVKGFYGRNHLDSGLTGRFVKGQAPPNKGKRQEEFMSPEAIERTKATRFKKGNVPHNHLEVGTVVLNTDGYYQKKVAEPNRWILLQRIVWEEHNGPIPEGMIVCFKDNNPRNCNIDNLMLESRAEHAVMNRWDLRSEHPELTETGLAVAKLKVAQGNARRRRRERGRLQRPDSGHSDRANNEEGEEAWKEETQNST